jgi:predicted DNA-binding transcriptional regulator YafY
MTKPLTEQEKRQNKIERENKRQQKKIEYKLDERCYEILRILHDAPNHPEIKFNSKYFQQYFKVANITILRSVATLKEMGLIEKKQVKGSYVIKKGVHNLYSEKEKNNLLLIASVKGLLQQYINTPLYENIKKFIYFLEPQTSKLDSILGAGRISVPPQIEYTINMINWNKILNAMENNYKISFRYTNPNTNNELRRIVCPYQLLLDNGTVYLFAHSEDTNYDLLFNLIFMKEIIVTNNKFTLPEDYDFSSRCAGGNLGAYKGNETEEYKIEFRNIAKTWIKYHKLAKNQEIIENEKSAIITFTSNQFEKVLQIILGWGKNAKPLAPKSLVTRWEQEVKAMFEMIQD